MLLVFGLSNQCRAQLAIVNTAQQQEDSSTAGEATTSAITASQHAHVPTHPSLVDTTPAEKLRSLLTQKRTECSSAIASPLHTKRACTFAEAANTTRMFQIWKWIALDNL